MTEAWHPACVVWSTFTRGRNGSSARTKSCVASTCGACPVASWMTPVERSAAVSRAESRRSEEHTSELQSRVDLVCRLLLEKKKKRKKRHKIKVAQHKRERSEIGI